MVIVRKTVKEKIMALAMTDKKAQSSAKGAWPAEIKAEFEREAQNPNHCVGSELLSENER
jgi:hypothetical protein